MKSLYLSVSSRDATGNQALSLHAHPTCLPASNTPLTEVNKPQRSKPQLTTPQAFPPHTLSCSRKGMWDS
jgi:hypothetical protein